jgi:N-acetylmuramoyl-L-alanine amidase
MTEKTVVATNVARLPALTLSCLNFLLSCGWCAACSYLRHGFLLPGKNFWQKSRFKLENKMAGKIHHLLALALLAALSACSLFPKRATTRDTTKTFKTVVVDAGHGGKDNGAYRGYGGAEKIATLDVAKRLERKLRESQLKTVMTRSSDVFIPLDERVEIENSQKNSIFVSIHFNDSRRRGVHGFETYYNASNSRDLADRVQSKLMTITRSANRGVHFANFRVLRLAKYPAVLVECGFLSNRREGGGARDSEFRELLADKIAEAIVEIRYGPGVYRATAAATTENPPDSSGPGLVPATLRHD